MVSKYDRGTELAGRLGRAISAFDVVAVLTALAVGIGLRVAWAVRTEAEPVSDGEWYHVVAQSIVSGDGITTLSDPVIPTALFPPGYPIVLAGAYKLFGDDLWVAQTVNMVAVAGTIVLTYAIGRMVFSRQVAAAAAFILAIFPSQVLFTPLVMSELLFTFFFTAAVALLLLSTQATPRQTLMLMAAAGFVVGAATLVRGQALVLVPLVPIWWWLQHRRPVRLLPHTPLLPGLVRLRRRDHHLALDHA